MNEFTEDSTIEGFYRRFRHGNPKGSVATFEKWYARIFAVQETVAVCPWCGKDSELLVLECQNNELGYTVLCRNDDCPVKPAMGMMYDIPEEARDVWGEMKEDAND